MKILNWRKFLCFFTLMSGLIPILTSQSMGADPLHSTRDKFALEILPPDRCVLPFLTFLFDKKGDDNLLKVRRCAVACENLWSLAVGDALLDRKMVSLFDHPSSTSATWLSSLIPLLKCEIWLMVSPPLHFYSLETLRERPSSQKKVSLFIFD